MHKMAKGVCCGDHGFRWAATGKDLVWHILWSTCDLCGGDLHRGVGRMTKAATRRTELAQQEDPLDPIDPSIPPIWGLSDEQLRRLLGMPH